LVAGTLIEEELVGDFPLSYDMKGVNHVVKSMADSVVYQGIRSEFPFVGFLAAVQKLALGEGSLLRSTHEVGADVFGEWASELIQCYQIPISRAEIAQRFG
jgi:hypothetical protein